MDHREACYDINPHTICGRTSDYMTVKCFVLLRKFFSSDKFTILAPSNKAFRDMPTPELADLVADKDQLVNFLKNHIIFGNISMVNSNNDDMYSNIAGHLLRLNTYEHNGVSSYAICMCNLINRQRHCLS